MTDPVVHITNGIPDSGTGNVTTSGAIVALLPTALGTGGGLKVDGSGTSLPVSGSVTAVSGTAANLKAAATLDAETTKVIGTVNLAATPTTNLNNIDSASSRLTSSATNIAAGSALATTSFIVGSRYLSTPPTFTNGQEGALQIGSAGQLIVKDAAAEASLALLVTAIGTPNSNGGATPTNSAPTVNADQYSTHKEVGASATATVLGATGATGDYLSHVTVYPGTAGCGVVTILDNATGIGTFAGGGTTALPTLVPFMIPVGAFSSSGAWKITTGANVTVSAVGKFT